MSDAKKNKSEHAGVTSTIRVQLVPDKEKDMEQYRRKRERVRVLSSFKK